MEAQNSVQGRGVRDAQLVFYLLSLLGEETELLQQPPIEALCVQEGRQ